MNRDEYADLLKSTALNLGQKFVMQYLVAKIPFLALPILNPIASFLIGYVLGLALKQTEFGLFFLYIDLRTSKQGREFEASALKNATAQKSGTPEEKIQAEAELINSFRAFVKFTN